MWPIDPVTKYALDVVNGDIVAGPYVRGSCRRHLEDMKRDDILLDVELIDRIFKFYNNLTLSEGQFEGIPFNLEPSQRFIVGSIFGFVRLNGISKKKALAMSLAERARMFYRRFRRAFIEEGKGNGKSPLVAGMGLYGLLADGEPGAQIYSAATSYDQADIMFQDAVKMAKANPKMERKIAFAGGDNVTNMAVLTKPQCGSFFRPVSSGIRRKGSGPRPHMALADEVHEHTDNKVIQILERGFKFRRQPLLVMITNSGSDRQSICWDEHVHACRVALGEIESDATFSYVCALDEGDDPFTDSSCWIKANPLLNVILTEEYLQGVVDDAKKIPANENITRRLHFCQWTESEKAWISRAAWEACEDTTLSLENLRGKRCRGGLDLSSTKDLSARALVFEDGFKMMPDGEVLPCFILWAHGYTPADTLKAREDRDKMHYSQWVKEGFLTATPGSVIRFSHIIKDLQDDMQNFDLIEVGYDAYLHPRFAQDMGDMGADIPMIEHPQGFSRRKSSYLWMPGSVNNFEDLILEGRLRIFVNPVLRAAVSGAKFVESPAGLKRFDKQGATQRIDAIIASTMAIGCATSKPDEEDFGPSVYEQKAAATAKGDVDESREPDLEQLRREFYAKHARDDDDDWSF